MEWFRQEAAYASDRRHARLARELGIPKPSARSLVDCLMSQVAQHFELEPLDLSPEELAEACEYEPAEGDKLLAAMLAVGWLEDVGGGRYMLRGWAEAQGRFLDERRKWRDKKRRQRERQRSESEPSPGDNANVQGDVPREKSHVPPVPTYVPTDLPTTRTRDEERAATRSARASAAPISELHYEKLLECWEIWQRRVSSGAEGSEYLQLGPHPEKWPPEKLKAAAEGLKLLHGSAGFEAWVDRLLEDDVITELLERLDSGSDTIRLSTALDSRTVNAHSKPHERKAWATWSAA